MSPGFILKIKQYGGGSFREPPRDAFGILPRVEIEGRVGARGLYVLIHRRCTLPLKLRVARATLTCST